MVVTETSSSAVVTLSRDVGSNILLIEPTVPLSVTFNGTTTTFSQIRLYSPAPTSIEHINADAVLQCMSDSLWMFIPLKKADSGPNIAFLSSIVGVLDPATSQGLGIVDPTTGVYAKATATPGQGWSIASLVNGTTDPYFTWINGTAESHVIDGCPRHITWTVSSGPRVIYFQKSIAIASADITKLQQMGTVLPADVKLMITDTRYSPGEAKNCTLPLPSVTVPTFDTDSTTYNALLYFGVLFIIFVAVIFAVSLATAENGFVRQTGAAFWKMFTFPTAVPRASARPPAAAPAPVIPLPAGLPAGAAALISKIK